MSVDVLDDTKPAANELVENLATYQRETREKVNELIELTLPEAFDWRIETVSVTAVVGDKIMVDTRTLACTVTLPASPNVGNHIEIMDAFGTFDTNNCTITRATGIKILGVDADLVLSDIMNRFVAFVYTGADYGWDVIRISSFDPRSPGAIGGSTPAAGTFTDLTDTALTASKPVFTDANKKLVSTGTLPVDQGGTNATTAPAALTSLGAEPTANKSTDGTFAANSDTLFPSQKATKTYITATSEALANKSVDGTFAANSDTLYPSQKAAKTYADTKEALANKSIDGTFADNSDTKYPSQKAVKTYVDTAVADSEADGVVGTWNQLVINVNATTITYNASGCVLTDALGNKLSCTGFSGTVDTASVGADGLDAGAFAAATSYYLYLISDAVNFKALLSTSATTPTMPAGYTHKLLVGAYKTKAGSAAFNVGFQRGNFFYYYANTSNNQLATGVTATTTVLNCALCVPAARVDRILFWGSVTSAGFQMLELMPHGGTNRAYLAIGTGCYGEAWNGMDGSFATDLTTSAAVAWWVGVRGYLVNI